MTGGPALAAAQTVPVPGDVEANVEAHLALAGVAASAGAGVVVFPELSLTGYELGLVDALAFDGGDPRLDPLRAAASEHAATLVVGAPLRRGARLHIAAFLLSPDGGVGLYTKRHLGAFSEEARVDGVVPPAEASRFAPGNLDPLVPLGDANAAVAICADTGRPEHPRAAAERGAAAYLASMFVIPSALEGDLANLRRIAASLAMHVVFANFGGPSGGLAAAGGSAIWAAGGERVAQLEGGGSGVVVARFEGGGARGEAISVEA